MNFYFFLVFSFLAETLAVTTEFNRVMGHGYNFSVDRIRTKLRSVELEPIVSNAKTSSDTPSPLKKTNFPVLDNRMPTSITSQSMALTVLAKPTLEKSFEAPNIVYTDTGRILLVWHSVLGRDVSVNVKGDFVELTVTPSAISYDFSQYVYIE